MSYSEDLADRIIIAMDAAIYTYKSDQQTKADLASVSFDAGRVDGLKQALEIIRKSWL